MIRFMLATFAFLGLGFYVLSGGSDFEPASARVAKADPLKKPVELVEVTPVSLNLATVAEVIKKPKAKITKVVPAKKDVPVIETPAVKTPAVDAMAVAEPDLEEPAIILPSLVANSGEAEVVRVAAASSSSVSDIRYVKGSRVNVRGGPGTDYEIVGRLGQGAEVEVIEDTGTGWDRLQTTDGRAEGWMADFLLTPRI